MITTCLTCKAETINKKYCSDKCKQKYYYDNKEGVKEKKITNVYKNRRIKFIEKYKQKELDKVNEIKKLIEIIK